MVNSALRFTLMSSCALVVALNMALVCCLRNKNIDIYYLCNLDFSINRKKS